jgi:hypothetical protein
MGRASVTRPKAGPLGDATDGPAPTEPTALRSSAAAGGIQALRPETTGVAARIRHGGRILLPTQEWQLVADRPPGGAAAGATRALVGGHRDAAMPAEMTLLHTLDAAPWMEAPRRRVGNCGHCRGRPPGVTGVESPAAGRAALALGRVGERDGAPCSTRTCEGDAAENRYSKRPKYHGSINNTVN